jgi:hypothetical protein
MKPIDVVVVHSMIISLLEETLDILSSFGLSLQLFIQGHFSSRSPLMAIALDSLQWQLLS